MVFASGHQSKEDMACDISAFFFIWRCANQHLIEGCFHTTQWNEIQFYGKHGYMVFCPDQSYGGM